MLPSFCHIDMGGGSFNMRTKNQIQESRQSAVYLLKKIYTIV